MLLGAGDSADIPGSVQGGHVEEFEGGVGLVDVSLGEAPLNDEVVEEGSDLLLVHHLGRLMKVPAEAIYVGQIQPIGLEAEPCQVHVHLHPQGKLIHGVSPLMKSCRGNAILDPPQR